MTRDNVKRWVMVMELLIKHRRLYEFCKAVSIDKIYELIRFSPDHIHGNWAISDQKVKFYDFEMMLDASSKHDYTFFKLYQTKETYEPDVSNFLLNNLNQRTLFIDVGANNGYYSMLASRNCDTIYAFEPVKNNYQRLLRNIELNGFKNITPYQIALGNKEENKQIYISEKEDGSDTMLKIKKAIDQETVRTQKLDNIMRNKNCESTIVKIDVEGYEREVIEGGREFIKACKPLIIFEFNYDILYYKNRQYNEVFELLASYGYSTFIDLSNGNKICNYKDLKGIITNIVAQQE